MTRETKVGIVVSCSFLCLVGVVVASKLRAGPPPPQEGATEALAQVKPKAAPTAARKPDKEAPLPSGPPGAAPTAVGDTEQPPTAAKPPTPPAPAASTPPGVIPAGFTYANTTAPAKEDKSNEGAAPKPPTDDNTTTWLGVPLPQQAEPKKEGTTVASAGPASGIGDNATPPPAAAAEGGVAPAISPTPPAPPSAPALPADITPPPSGVDTANTDKKDSDKKEKEGDVKEGADGGEKGEKGKGDKDKKLAADEVMPAPPGAVAVPPGSAPASAPEKASTEKPEVPADSSKTAVAPTTRLGAPDKLPGGGTENEGTNKPKKEGDRPAGEKTDAVPSAPAVPALPEGVTPPPGTPAPAEEKKGESGPPPRTEEKAAGTVPPMVAPPPGADLDKVKPPAAEKAEEKSRPVSAAPAATIAPVVARTAEGPRPTVGAARPVVESFSEEEYTVKPGDTYATISQAKYYSQNYAEALRLYNRNDSLLSDGADGTGGLKPGQKVSVPDLRILEKRYSHVLPKVPTEGTSRKTSAHVQPVKDAKVLQEKAPSYTVRRGETMRSIAKGALGNGDRWEEIYRLNRSYNPEVELPVGAVLRLPPLGERGVSTP